MRYSVAAMTLSRSNSHSKGEKTVKHMLFAICVAVLFLNSFVVPTVAHADVGGGGGGNCGGSICKP
jgi:hypothetical protein